MDETRDLHVRSGALDEIVDSFAHRVAVIVMADIRASQAWVDQHASELGPRRHCAAVRRRRDNDEPGATIQGKRFLLSAAAHAEELSRSLRPIAKADDDPEPANDDPEQAAYERTMRRYGGRPSTEQAPRTAGRKRSG